MRRGPILNHFRDFKTPSGRRYGENRIATMLPQDIAAALKDKSPNAKKNWMKTLRHLMVFAIAENECKADPTNGMKTTRPDKSTGHMTWGDAQIGQHAHAVFAGDRQHVGVLKSLITEPYLTIEGKYQNGVQTPNFLHVMMASNEEWVVPASLEARRFCCHEVSDAHKDDHAYFGAIWEQMEAGGYAAMLYDLLHIDVTTFNVRRVPVTDGLQQQKMLSLDTNKSWWLDVLHRGYVFRSKLGLEDFFSKWHDEVATELLYASYADFAEKRRDRHPLGREMFGKFMVSLGTKPQRLRKLAVGEHMTDASNASGGTTRKAEPILHPRPPAYHLGALAEARAAFTGFTKLPVEWPQQDDQDKAA